MTRGRDKTYRVVPEQVERVAEARAGRSAGKLQRAPVQRTVDRSAAVALQQPAADRRRPLAAVEQERRVWQLTRPAGMVVMQVGEQTVPIAPASTPRARTCETTS